MKKQLFILGFLVTITLLLNSCSKQNDSGALIDGNGRARQASVTTVARDTVRNGYGIAIDPDGSR